ncbi:Myosin tail 2 [Cynara cardunculus var. scolymus]|uniref:Myosin tail 2 n=2 Tax=Cynara cardunculus var. scolymus TaxID=59895 RepID=A0A103Y8Y5_CYNCS|nr:Myosin tail 2 [Cynara cardunculus var. scolymus]
MSSFPRRKVQIEYKLSDTGDEDKAKVDLGYKEGSDEPALFDGDVRKDHDPFSGGKVRRKASMARTCRGDYIDVRSKPYLMKILEKQGDRGVIFSDKVLKFTGLGKMKRRILLITDFAIYIVDPEARALKRRIALAAVERLCLSELSDNFFAVIVPTEYDLLMASTRKTEIVTLLVESMKTTSNYELEVHLSNSFEYNASSDLVKEIQFEEVEDGTRTRIVNK